MTALPARFGSALLAATVTAGLALALATPAGALPRVAKPAAAPTAAGAAVHAAALRAQVDALQTAAEVASEDYANSQAQVSDVIAQHLDAERELTAATANSADDANVADNRIRAIYMTGGKAGLLSSVLGAHDLGDLTARLHTMDSLVDADHTRVAAGLEVTGQAAIIEARLAKLSAQKLALDKQSAAAAERVRTSLAAAQELLAAADARVRVLAEKERLAAEAASVRDFAAQLAAARAGAGIVDLGPGAPPSAIAAAAINAARTRLGLPYVWGATGPDSFDCSGLTGWSYLHAGIRLPRTSREQWYAGSHPGLAELAPGDLLFWATNPALPASIHHVAIYLGSGMMIAAPQTGDVVKVQAVYSHGYFGAVRPQA